MLNLTFLKIQHYEEREEFNQKAEPYLEQITLKHNWGLPTATDIAANGVNYQSIILIHFLNLVSP